MALIAWTDSMTFPPESCLRNFVKKRNASWLIKRFAMMNARRSGSDTSAVSRAMAALTAGSEK